MKTIPVQKLRRNLGEILSRAGYLNQKFTVTRSGKPMIVILSVDEYRSLTDQESQDS